MTSDYCKIRYFNQNPKTPLDYAHNSPGIWGLKRVPVDPPQSRSAPGRSAPNAVVPHRILGRSAPVLGRSAPL